MVQLSTSNIPHTEQPQGNWSKVMSLYIKNATSRNDACSSVRYGLNMLRWALWSGSSCFQSTEGEVVPRE